MTNILIVDDERSILTSFQKFFKGEGYTTFVALNAQEALDILQTNPIDLAILDVILPGMSGIELAKKIRKDSNSKDLKIIFLTVVKESNKDMAQLIKDVNPASWLQKPVDFQILHQAVIKALGVRG